MAALFLIFSRRIIFTFTLFFSLATLLLLLVEKLAGIWAYSMALFMIPYVGLGMLIPYLNTRLISRNGNWI